MTLVVFLILNLRCQLFFGPGTTSVLKFGHGWPIHYQEGPVPGPGKSKHNPKGNLPNYVWGQPEYNNHPEIMAEYIGALNASSRTPWALSELATPRPFAIVFDALSAFFALFLIGLLREIAIHYGSKAGDRSLSIASCVLFFTFGACAVLIAMPRAWIYIVAAFCVVIASIIATSVTMSHASR